MDRPPAAPTDAPVDKSVHDRVNPDGEAVGRRRYRLVDSRCFLDATVRSAGPAVSSRLELASVTVEREFCRLPDFASYLHVTEHLRRLRLTAAASLPLPEPKVVGCFRLAQLVLNRRAMQNMEAARNVVGDLAQRTYQSDKTACC